MPFTFSHPAIVLPFLRRRRKIFSATGLIVGSIAPDFESFIRIDETKIYSHSWLGMFWFDLPLAFIICNVFHLLVRDAMIENLPLPLAERFIVYKNFKWVAYLRSNFLIVIFSLLIGIFSHLLWDAFTHLNLRDPDSTKSTIMFGHMRLYIFLQYGCSLAGMLIVIWTIKRLPRTRVSTYRTVKFPYWVFVILFAALIGAFIYTGDYYQMRMSTYMEGYVMDFVYISISSSLASLIIVSVLYTLFFKKRVHA